MPPNNPPHIALTRVINNAIAAGMPRYTNQTGLPMLKKHVTTITFDEDGSVEYTRNKNLTGFFGGRGEMKRVTDIVKHIEVSVFGIEWKLGPYAGLPHSTDLHAKVFGASEPIPDNVTIRSEHTKVFWFPDYEDAVAYEILCLNKMREQGVTFGA